MQERSHLYLSKHLVGQDDSNHHQKVQTILIKLDQEIAEQFSDYTHLKYNYDAHPNLIIARKLLKHLERLSENLNNYLELLKDSENNLADYREKEKLFDDVKNQLTEVNSLIEKRIEDKCNAMIMHPNPTIRRFYIEAIKIARNSSPIMTESFDFLLESFKISFNIAPRILLNNQIGRDAIFFPVYSPKELDGLFYMGDCMSLNETASLLQHEFGIHAANLAFHKTLSGLASPLPYYEINPENEKRYYQYIQDGFRKIEIVKKF